MKAIPHRRLLFEPLEKRLLLSGISAPDDGWDVQLTTPSASEYLERNALDSLTGTIDGHRVSIDRRDDPSQPIEASAPTWLVIHGYNSSPARFDELADGLHLATGGDQVLTLDWSEIAALSIWSVENYITAVAEWASSAMTSFGFSGTLLNAVGHSFGAYVAAEMAERIAGGVNTIVGLDPAENWPGGYNPEGPGEVDFGAYSAYSWAFSDAGGFFGSEVTPGSADEAFAVENTSHSGVVDLFSNMLQGIGSADVLQFFPVTRLLGRTPGPWTPNQYDHGGYPSTSGIYEAVITADSSGAVPLSITFVALDAAPPTISAVERNDGADRFDQLKSLRLVFSESVASSLDKNDLALTNLTTNVICDMGGAGFSYDASANAGYWDLQPLLLSPGYYQVTLIAAGVTDAAGNQLDGDNDGSPGGDFNVRGDQNPELLLVGYPGDANLDGRVGPVDLSALAANWGQPGGWDDGDFSANGIVGPEDLSALAAHWGMNVPPPLVSRMSEGGKASSRSLQLALRPMGAEQYLGQLNDRPRLCDNATEAGGFGGTPAMNCETCLNRAGR